VRIVSAARSHPLTAAPACSARSAPPARVARACSARLDAGSPRTERNVRSVHRDGRPMELFAPSAPLEASPLLTTQRALPADRDGRGTMVLAGNSAGLGVNSEMVPPFAARAEVDERARMGPAVCALFRSCPTTCDKNASTRREIPGRFFPSLSVRCDSSVWILSPTLRRFQPWTAALVGMESITSAVSLTSRARARWTA